MQEKTKEDDDFDKEFSKMMLESRNQGVGRRNLDLAIPLELQNESASVPKVPADIIPGLVLHCCGLGSPPPLRA